MKHHRIIFSLFLAAVATALVVIAAPGDFDFLKEFEEMSSDWHRSSIILKILTLAVSVLGACVAFLQSKKITLPKKETVTATVSLVIACLNGALALYFADSRTYETAATRCDAAIREFRVLNESTDISDPQLAEEFSHAKADLIQKLYGIRVELISGKVSPQVALISMAYAQDPSVWKPSDTANFVYAIGAGSSPGDLQQAKAIAIQDADAKLISGAKAGVELDLSRQSLSEEAKTRVLSMLFNASANAELLSHAEIEKTHFVRTQSTYKYSVMKRVLREVVTFHYVNLLRTQPTLTGVPGLSMQKLEQDIRLRSGH